jgi:non-ribosomal peptide synthetase component E (peptide arylation enzyme)
MIEMPTPNAIRDPAPGAYDWANRTLVDAFGQAVAQSPEKTLVVAGDSRLSYGDVAAQVEKLTRGLAALGLGKGDVVSIQLPNWAEFIVIHLAVTRLGAITNTLLPNYRAKELGYILSFAKTKMVFAPALFRGFDYRPLYRDLRERLSDLEHIVFVGGEAPADMTAYDDLLRGADEAAPAVALNSDEINVLIFTSGTESTPKGVVHSHNTMAFGNQAVAERLRLTSEEVIWAASPIGHATGLQWAVRQAIMLGATVVLQEAFEPVQAVDLIERERCTLTTAATPFANMLLDVPGIANRDLSCFRYFVCGGATIPSALGKMMREKIGVTLLPLWGMSEAFISTLCAPTDPERYLFGSDGRALPGVEMAIFDVSRTRQLAPGEEGEIATRGPQVCLGYFKDPERTAASFSSDGWLFSGDLGVLDENGYLRVQGRIKDVINRGGLKISAGEIEELLLNHPAIGAIAIVGIPDKKLGEKACACVSLRSGKAVALRELVDLLRERDVATYKFPEFLAFVDEMPMTATGKVQKFKLRDDLVSGALPMLGA